jgi:histone-lysine N-methyltransferase SETMAR
VEAQDFPNPLKCLGLKNLLAKSWQLFSGMRKDFFLEFMPQKITITGQTYANTITALREAIKEKGRGKLSTGVPLLHDNAPVHMSAKSEAVIRQCGFQQLNHPPYSPDLAPSDYFLFRVTKTFLRGKQFSSDEDVKEKSRPSLKSSQKIFFHGDKVIATKVGEVY